MSTAATSADPRPAIQVHERDATPPLHSDEAPAKKARNRNSYSWQTEQGRRRVQTLCTRVLETEHEGQVHTPLSHHVLTPTVNSCCIQPDISKHMQNIFAVSKEHKQKIFEGAALALRDVKQSGTSTPLFNPCPTAVIVQNRWNTTIQHVKKHGETCTTDTPQQLHIVLQKMHAGLCDKQKKAAQKETEANDRRERSKVAEKRVTDRPISTRLEGSATPVPTSHPCIPAFEPPHTCWSACKRHCPFGGPGPVDWCRQCNYFSRGGLYHCKRCECLAKSAERDTPFKFRLGGTCCAYLDTDMPCRC